MTGLNFPTIRKEIKEEINNPKNNIVRGYGILKYNLLLRIKIRFINTKLNIPRPVNIVQRPSCIDNTEGKITNKTIDNGK